MEQAVKRFPPTDQAITAEPQSTPAGQATKAAAASEAAASELRGEFALRYCPVCSQRLESRRCKLICNRCGYYMSCADYI